MPADFDAFVRAYQDDDLLPMRRYSEAYTFFAVLGKIGGGSVLDLGCGAGLYTRRLAERGASRVVGIDISEPMIAYARAREDEEGLGIEYVVGQVTQAPAQGAFDVVTAVHVFPYAEDRDQLRAMYRSAYDALRPGGRLVAVVMNPDVRFTTRDFYARYGATAFPDSFVDGSNIVITDGTSVRLVSEVPGLPVDVQAYYWSRDSHEAAAMAAGFQGAKWHPVAVSADGIARFGESYWQPLLDNPPAVPVVCTKPA